MMTDTKSIMPGRICRSGIYSKIVNVFVSSLWNTSQGITSRLYHLCGIRGTHGTRDILINSIDARDSIRRNLKRMKND